MEVLHELEDQISSNHNYIFLSKLTNHLKGRFNNFFFIVRTSNIDSQDFTNQLILLNTEVLYYLIRLPITLLATFEFSDSNDEPRFMCLLLAI